jgi:hypothetical protein
LAAAASALSDAEERSASAARTAADELWQRERDVRRGAAKIDALQSVCDESKIELKRLKTTAAEAEAAAVAQRRSADTARFETERRDMQLDAAVGGASGFVFYLCSLLSLL